MPVVRRGNCQLCGYFCGALVTVGDDGRVAAIKPDPDRYPYDPAVIGKCRRFSANREILDHPGRINHPLKRSGERGSGKWTRISWEQAMEEIAARLEDLKARFGAESLATCISAPHTVYWPMHRFMNAWGSPNNIGMGIVCWNPRIWVNTLTCGWPVDDELRPDLTRSTILWGLNPAQSDRSVFWRNLNHFARQGGHLIVVDPRRTETARLTKDWVSIKPGTDAALALGMLHVILQEGLHDQAFVRDWCVGFDALAERVREYAPGKVAAITGVPAEDVRRIARLYATERPSSIFSGLGIDQSGFNCTQALRAIAILRAVTGNIDVPGASLLNDRSNFVSEVALELPHLLPEEQKRKKLGAGRFALQRHEGYERMLQFTMRHGKQLPARYMTSTHPALAWQAMITGEPYPVRALVCMASNPLLCQADTRQVHRALSSLDLLVTLEKFLTPTAMLADYVLPITGGFEQAVVQMNGGVANVLYGGAPAIAPLHERRTDFEFWMDLGKRCGQAEHWPWGTLPAAMDDVLDPTGLTWREFCETGLYAPEPAYFKYLEQGFATPSGKVELQSTLLEEAGHDPLPAFRRAPDAGGGDLLLITGVRKQPYYASEFRQVARLRRLHPEPLAEMSAETAASLGLKQRDLVWIATDKGRIRHRLDIVEMHPRTVSVELGWWFPERAATEPELGGLWEANANVLTSADVAGCDPVLGQWSFRGIPCRVYPAVDLDHAVVRQARTEEDAAALAELLAVDDMDCSAVPVEEFSVLVDRDEIVAALRLEDHGDTTMVRPIVVAARYRGQGLGRHLLERVMPTDRRTTLVARGHAAGFYSRVGFSTTSWEHIPAPQREECGRCPERDACAPQPMVRPPQRPPVQRGADSAGHGRANTAMHPREERS